jgi:hypothetical protein
LIHPLGDTHCDYVHTPSYDSVEIQILNPCSCNKNLLTQIWNNNNMGEATRYMCVNTIVSHIHDQLHILAITLENMQMFVQRNFKDRI